MNKQTLTLIGKCVLMSMFCILGCNQNKKSNSEESNHQTTEIKKIKIEESINDFYKSWAGANSQNNIVKDSKTYNELWGKMDSNLLSPITKWKTTALPADCQNTTFLFYPFSGPDFLIPNTIFPNISHMIMFGLEKPGKDISNKGIDFAKSSMPKMQVSLRDYCNKSYFITKNMNLDLKNDTLSGVVPLIATFLVKENFKIISIKNFKLVNNGEKKYYDASISQNMGDTTIGVEFNYTKNENDTLKIDYLSFNAEDNSLKNHKEVTGFLENNIPSQTISYLKSASYLLHYESFSEIRKIVLDKSKYILQDDTGVAYDYFDKNKWAFDLWGIYEKPIKDFSGVFQKNLDSLYKFNKQAKPLPFNMGYHFFNGNQNLMLAKRR